MDVYANVDQMPKFSYGDGFYKIKEKELYIPLNNIKQTALTHLKLKSNVHALVIYFKDFSKVDKVVEYTRKEFDEDFKDYSQVEFVLTI